MSEGFESRFFSKKIYRGPSSTQKRCSTSLVSRERVKTKTKQCFVPTRDTKVKKANDDKYWQECGGIGALRCCRQDCKMTRPCGNSPAIPQLVKQSRAELSIVASGYGISVKHNQNVLKLVVLMVQFCGCTKNY